MRFAAAILVAVPPLYPFTSGPSPQVQPWLASMACGGALWWLASRDGAHWPPRGLTWGFLLAVAWAVLSHFAVRPEILMLAAGLLLVLAAAGAARDPRIAEGLQAGLLAAAALSALMGLAQYFGIAHLAAPWISGADPGIAFANLRQTNQYATLCWIGGAIVLFGTLRLPRWAGPALVVLLATACAASVSRTGMLEGVLLAALAVLWPGPDQRRRLLLAVLALATYFAAAAVLPVLFAAATGSEPQRVLWTRLGGADGCASRAVLWSNVLQLIAQRPLAGWGWGELDYAHYMNLYAQPRFCEILDNAHNLPLHLAVELGLPAAVLACGALFVWAWRRRPWEEADSLRRLAWAVLALVGVHSLLEYPLWYGPFQIIVGLCFGWLAAPAVVHANASALPRWAGAALVAAGIGYVAWDYARVSQIYLPPESRRAAWSEDTLDHVRRSWLFAGPARFADVTLAAASRANAAWMYAEANSALHYSSEPRVIERVIESAVALGRDEEALLHLVRYREAFPQEYAAWRERQRQPLPSP